MIRRVSRSEIKELRPPDTCYAWVDRARVIPDDAREVWGETPGSYNTIQYPVRFLADQNGDAWPFNRWGDLADDVVFWRELP